MLFSLPYGHGHLPLFVPDQYLEGVLRHKPFIQNPNESEADIVQRSLNSPISSPTLDALARGKQSVVIISSDHTRPVPSKITMPLLLAQIRKGNPNALITILVATGCHRAPTYSELIDKYGEEIVEHERIVIHDCDDTNNIVYFGRLPSGGACYINRLAIETDLLVAEGFIEPHFFAGFSGGRKSVLPGIASRSAVQYNHCSAFIDHPCSRTGILEQNPIHEDMMWAARKARLAFILNVLLDENKRVVYAVSGDMDLAHLEGCDYLMKHALSRTRPADIVVCTNGGYPLDQNLYQAVKGMTAAEAAVRENGIIVMLAKAEDGIGGEHFQRQLSSSDDLEALHQIFLSRDATETEPDQWQTQILLRVLKKAKVILVSSLPAEVVQSLHMIPANTAQEAFDYATTLLNNDEIRVTIIPDGVGVVIQGTEDTHA
ncbi:MAG: nickel-dependent lactate racemase [Clostridiaceae bacterium]|jgi:nickel-dependent lactate racemase|nr:nickel-dependent lactate racemase [Clostridiaceae bacterium]